MSEDHPWRIYLVRGEIDEETAYIQARSSMARALEINGKARQAEGEAKVVTWKAPSWKRNLRIRNSRKPSRTHVRSWKTSVAPAVTCEILKNCGSGASNKLQTKFSAHLMDICQDQEWLPVWGGVLRLMNSRRKGPNRKMTKVQWLCWRSVIGMKENLLPTNVTIDRRNLVREVMWKWD